MNIKDFDIFLAKEIDRIKLVLGSKSADYSQDGDKLFNFKLLSPIEALRGNWLKHRASVIQGLDDLQTGKVRPLKWWEEKLVDDRNYNILLHALLIEIYFDA